MLRRCLETHRASNSLDWHARNVSSKVQPLAIRRRKLSTKADGFTKKPVPSRKRQERADNVKVYGVTSGTGVAKVSNRAVSDSTISITRDSESTVEVVPFNKLKPRSNRTRLSMAFRVFSRRLVQNRKHYDRASFLRHATERNLNPDSPTFKGTLYEYTTADTLMDYNFSLEHVGKSNDQGIDLLGQWRLPGTRQLPNLIDVYVQCKASKPQPRMARELEASSAGAQARLKEDGVFRLLAAKGDITRGVRDALQRSRYPMGFAHIAEDGKMKQFWWNDIATQTTLGRMLAVLKYDAQGNESVSITWDGKTWRPKKQSLTKSTSE